MLFQQRGLSPVQVHVTGPFTAETTGDYGLRSSVDTSIKLCGGETGVLVYDREQPGDTLMTLAAVPRFMGHWLISPLFPIPLIPLFGLPRQPTQSRVILLVWGHPTRKVGIDVASTWIKAEDSEQTVPISLIGAGPSVEPSPVRKGTTTLWLSPLTEGTKPAAGRDSTAIFFEMPSEGGERISANIAIELGNGERGSVRVDLRKRSSLVYDLIGSGIGWWRVYE